MNSLALQNSVPSLLQALSQKEPISEQAATTMQRINTMQHAGLIPPFEALLLKNNLNNTLFAEGVLSDLILDLIKQGKIAPEMKQMATQRGIHETIQFLYTCHLEQTYSTLDPYILQQKLLGFGPKKLLNRMLEAEEMESKKYVKEWLHSLRLSKSACKQALAPLLNPLTCLDFKKNLLNFIETLRAQEEEIVHQFCLQELQALLQTKKESNVFFTFAQFLKAFRFYQKYTDRIDKKFYTNHQFSLCLAADAIKNGPFHKEIPTFYHLLYGKIKSSVEEPKLLIVQGDSSDDNSISKVIQALCNKIKKPFVTFHASSTPSLPTLVRALLKEAPKAILAPLSENTSLLLEGAKALHLPLTFFPAHSEASRWQAISQNPYPNFRIAFPNSSPLNTFEELRAEKTTISGSPCIFSEHASPEKLKQKWGFSSETKVIAILDAEKNCQWPNILAQEYTNSKNLALIVLTDEKNTSFIHKIKTKIRPQTNLPLHIYSSLTPKEREEIMILADLLIAKAPSKGHQLLFEAHQAKTPILLDRSPPSLFSQGFLGFCKSLGKLFALHTKNSEESIQEKIVSDLNLGLFIRSPKNFKSAIEELISQPPVETLQSTSFSDAAPIIIEEMEKEALKTPNSPLSGQLKMFS